MKMGYCGIPTIMENTWAKVWNIMLNKLLKIAWMKQLLSFVNAKKCQLLYCGETYF